MRTCKDTCLVGPGTVGTMNEVNVKGTICESFINKFCVVVGVERGKR